MSRVVLMSGAADQRWGKSSSKRLSQEDTGGLGAAYPVTCPQTGSCTAWPGPESILRVCLRWRQGRCYNGNSLRPRSVTGHFTVGIAEQEDPLSIPGMKGQVQMSLRRVCEAISR